MELIRKVKVIVRRNIYISVRDEPICRWCPNKVYSYGSPWGIMPLPVIECGKGEKPETCHLREEMTERKRRRIEKEEELEKQALVEIEYSGFPEEDIDKVLEAGGKALCEVPGSDCTTAVIFGGRKYEMVLHRTEEVKRGDWVLPRAYYVDLDTKKVLRYIDTP